MRHLFQIYLTVVFLALIGASPTQAEENDATPTDPSQFTVPATVATVENIMERAVQNIARRYNLNATQTEFTSQMMTERVRKFLLEHEDEVWPVIRDLLSAQLGANPPSDEEALKQLGRTAGPLAKLAQEAILQAQDDWRPILTEEQKKMHDFDLEEMRRQFKDMDDQFDAWAKGERWAPGTQGSNPVIGRPIQKASPPTPPRPGEVPIPPKILDGPPISTLFDTFVEEFIKDYKLDQSQIDSARSILKEFKGKATDLKNSRKHDFARLAEDQKKAIEAKDLPGLKEAEAARKKLLEPVYDLFGEMQDRLRGLLTTTQIQRYEAAKKEARAKRKETKRVRRAERKKKTQGESKVKKKEAPPKKSKPAKEPEKTTPTEKTKPDKD
ncbi:MAG: hypothetical protein JSU63_21415 [Phycisphaerales bacterium]|nr:MAG: hypothetical protein JSU63_21415 [Phycisphaerales bacterium]